MVPSDAQAWYASIEKPFFAPPASVFAPVWSFLYLLIVISFTYVFYQVLRRKWPAMVALPFLINLVANFLFSPIQFGLQNNLLALIDILIILGSLIWMVIVIWPRARWVAWMQASYLLWVSFATVLQVSVTWLNW